MESPTVRERRLPCRRERAQQAHRAAETAAEKEERLRKHRKRDQKGRAAETEEQREGYRENVLGRVKDFQLKLKNCERSD